MSHYNIAHKLANEKSKFDNARRLRGICFIDPEDGEYKEIIKDARKKLQVPMEAAILCHNGTKKRSSFQETEATSCDSKDKACMHRGSSWVHETTFGMISTERSEDHMAGKGYNSIAQYALVRKFISGASSDEHSGCDSSRGQRIGEARKVARVAIDQSKEQNGGG